MLSIVHEANQNEFSAALAFKLSLLKTHILSPDSHGRSGVKLCPYPDIVGIRKDIHSQLCQVPSPYSALLELFRQVTPALTQPPPPPCPRLTPNLTVSLLKECTAQKRLGRGVEEAGVPTPELSVECRTLRPFSTHESRRPVVDLRAPYSIDSTYAIVWW